MGAEMLTQARMVELFDYDGSDLIWRVRPAEDFATTRAWGAWNARYAGTSAGWVEAHGYIRVSLGDRAHYAHRLIFLREYGWFPDQVDHINGLRDDNRLCNLRAADNTTNARNSKLRVDNTSSRVGVSWHENRWRALLFIDGRYISLGRFTDFDAACAARAAAEVAYGFHPNHGRPV